MSQHKTPKIMIYDTTLRDGEQSPGNTMSMAQKLFLFDILDNLGVDYVDIGFPSANESDFKLCQKLISMQKNCKLSALARANVDDINKTVEAFSGDKQHQIQILLLGSEIHARKKRNITLTEAINEAALAIDTAKCLGITDISVGLEDATRAGETYLHDIIMASVEAGAQTIVIPDTVGAMIPEEIYLLIDKIRNWVGPTIKLSIHCHNDLGLATANTIAAIQAGVDCIQATLCGIGERAGNAALEEVLAVLHYKKTTLARTHCINLKALYRACQALKQTLKLNLGKHKPIVGDNAFSTAAGIHIHGLMKDPEVYEFVKPNDFGIEQRFVINKHAGRAAIKNKLNLLGLDTDPGKVEMMLMQIKTAANSENYDDDVSFVKLYQQVVNFSHAKV